MACQAILKESIKELKGVQTETAVMNVVDYICQQRYFDHIYVYPTYEITDACTVFRGDFEAEIE